MIDLDVFQLVKRQYKGYITCKTFTPTLLATIVSMTACKNFSCHKSESGIDKQVKLTNDTNNIVMDHAILVETL